MDSTTKHTQTKKKATKPVKLASKNTKEVLKELLRRPISIFKNDHTGNPLFTIHFDEEFNTLYL